MFACVGLIVGVELPGGRSLGRVPCRTVGRIATRARVCDGNRESVRTAFFCRDSIVAWQFTSFGRAPPHHGCRAGPGRKRRRMRAWQADPAMPPVVLLRSPAEVDRWPASVTPAPGTTPASASFRHRHRHRHRSAHDSTLI